MKAEELTKEQRWKIADALARDRLSNVNKMCQEVHPRETFYSTYMKRVLDILVSAVVLVITLPFHLLVTMITAFDVGSPVLFFQERAGKDGKRFHIIKFRNMKEIHDDRGELLPGKERVTKFGAFMRMSSLDELLNFWSVFIGDMSIIGPRPLVPEYTHRYNKRHIKRLSMRPGLECPPRGKIDHVRDWQEQFEDDIWYVENVSFKTDLHMVRQLVRFALDKKNATARASSSRGTFMGYSEEGRAITLDDIPESYIKMNI